MKISELAVRKICFYLTAIFVGISPNKATASTWLKLVDTNINLERISFVTPLFCSSVGISDVRYNGIPGRGECSFSVVFSGQYTTLIGKDRYSGSSRINDAAVFGVQYGDDVDYKNETEAKETLQKLFNQLPNQ